MDNLTVFDWRAFLTFMGRMYYLRSLTTAGFLLSLATGAAAQQRQFDLICVGELITVRPAGIERTDYSPRYRIDLDRGVWCTVACGSVHDFSVITPTLIELRPPSNRFGQYSGLTVDLSTGRLRDFTELISGGTSSVDSECQRATYTEIPPIG